MNESDSIDNAILNMLKVNMGYKDGERILVVGQTWGSHLGEQRKAAMDRHYEVATRIHSVLKRKGYDITLVGYTPENADFGTDVTSQVYNFANAAEIVFMPTAFSLTQSKFRGELVSNGARIASMPTFTLDMFAEGGPMSVDYAEVDRATREVADRLRSCKYVHVTSGDLCDMWVEVDPELVHASTGLILTPGSCMNLPGAEAYVVPKHLGNSRGYFTVPKGWGGMSALEHCAAFTVSDGRFKSIHSNNSAEAQKYIEQVIYPLILEEYGAGKGSGVLAEMGIGMNPIITLEYIAAHGWSPLLAEKIFRTAHFANGKNLMFGGINDAPRHVDWVVPNVTIEYVN
jgi:leucyl aminopeptidase (aminopeptidase T)